MVIHSLINLHNLNSRKYPSIPSQSPKQVTCTRTALPLPTRLLPLAAPPRPRCAAPRRRRLRLRPRSRPPLRRRCRGRGAGITEGDPVANMVTPAPTAGVRALSTSSPFLTASRSPLPCGHTPPLPPPGEPPPINWSGALALVRLVSRVYEFVGSDPSSHCPPLSQQEDEEMLVPHQEVAAADADAPQPMEGVL